MRRRRSPLVARPPAHSPNRSCRHARRHSAVRLLHLLSVRSECWQSASRLFASSTHHSESTSRLFASSTHHSESTSHLLSSSASHLLSTSFQNALHCNALAATCFGQVVVPARRSDNAAFSNAHHITGRLLGRAQEVGRHRGPAVSADVVVSAPFLALLQFGRILGEGYRGREKVVGSHQEAIRMLTYYGVFVGPLRSTDFS